MDNSILKHSVSAFFIVLSLTACGQKSINEKAHETGNNANHKTILNCQNSKTDQSISIERGWVRAPQKGQKVTAAYFTICNQTENQDRLIKVSTKRANAAELHETKTLENGRVSMKPVGTLLIPAKESISLEPGGYHIMLIDLAADVAETHDLNIEVTFEKAGTLTTTLPLKKSFNENSQTNHQDDHQGH